jgi:hypothetical protein
MPDNVRDFAMSTALLRLIYDNPIQDAICNSRIAKLNWGQIVCPEGQLLVSVKTEPDKAQVSRFHPVIFSRAGAINRPRQ